jgi:hypothetical protein
VFNSACLIPRLIPNACHSVSRDETSFTHTLIKKSDRTRSEGFKTMTIYIIIEVSDTVQPCR